MLQPCSRFFWVCKPSGFPVLFTQQTFFWGYLFAKHTTSFQNHNPTVIWSCLYHCPDFLLPVSFPSLLSMVKFTPLFPSPTFALYSFCLFFYLFIPRISSHLSSPNNPSFKSLQIPTPMGLQMLYVLFPKAKLMIIMSSPTDLKIATLHMAFLSRGTKSCTFLTVLCTLWTVSKS